MKTRLILLLLCFPIWLFAKGMVVGYMPDYRPEPTDAQLQNVTHVIPFSLQVGTSGDLITSNVPGWLTSNFVTKAHTNGAKVIICVGGWGRSDGFSGATSSGKANFIQNLMDFVAQYNLDGIDLDWEFPSSGEMNSYGTFLSDLKTAMGTDKYLSIAVGGSHQPSEFPTSILNAVDAIHIMAYDMEDTWPAHSDYTESINLVNSWWTSASATSPTFKKEKLVLGVPFYTKGLGVITYADLINNGGSAAANSDTWGGYDYNGIPTIQNKTAAMYNSGYGGIMIWELAQDLDPTDQYSLLKAINTKTDELGGYSVGKTYKITVTSGIGGTVSPSGSVSVDSSKSKTFTITPDQFFLVEDVKLDGTSQGAVTSFTISNVTAEHSLDVTFKKDPNAPNLYVLTTIANANGTITPSGTSTIPDGSSKSVTISGNTGYVVDYVKIDNTIYGPVTSISFKNIRADHSVESFYKKATGGDLGKYALWESPFDFTPGDTIAHNDTLWKYQGNAGVGGWGSDMEPSVKLDYNYDPSGFGVTPWLYVGLYNSLPDTLITAAVEYRGSVEGSDTLIITTDSSSGGNVYGSKIDTVYTKPTATVHSTVKSVSAIVIAQNGLNFTAPVAGTYRVALFDLRGRELFSRSVNAAANQTVATALDKALVSRGVYLMQVGTGSIQTIQRIQN